ncbi:MAG: PAS domain S-box protein, partial [Melioribacteraceae bacterium]|nr:PAS domain S-box protein [Melioribacteraceae bacterium]
MVGWTEEELLQMTVFDVTADKQDTSTFERTKTVEEGVPVTVVLVRKDGTEFIAEVTGKILSIKGKKSVLGTIRDITGRKLAEDKLKISEERFQSIYNDSPIGIEMYDSQGVLISVNKKCLDLFGVVDIKQLEGFNLFDDPNLPEDAKNKIKKGEQFIYELDFDFELVKRLNLYETIKSGKRIFECHISKWGNPASVQSGYLLSILDITDRKKARENLHKSEKRFKQVVEATGEWIWEVDKNGLYTYASKVSENLLGYKPDEIVGKKHFYDFFKPEIKNDFKKAASEVFSKKESFENFENPNIHKDGRIVILETSGTPLLDSKGNLLGYRGVDKDITERKQAETALKESEIRFRTIIEQAGDSMFLIDFSGNIIDVNNYARERLGYNREELLSMQLGDLDSAYMDEDKQKIIRNKLISEGIVTVESEHKRKDGKKFPVEIRISTIEIEGEQVMLGFARDITERKQVEEALHNIAVSFAAVRGQEFFNKVSNYLTDKLNVDYAFIGELIDEDKVRIIGGFGKGNVLDPFEYDLKNTPCENVMEQSTCCYSSGVRKLFPKDHLLTEMSIDGYLGTPLIDSSGKSVGIIVLLNEQPITNQKIAESTLQIFSDRVSAEVQRKQTEEALRDNEERLNSFMESSTDGIILYDSEMNLIDINKKAMEIFLTDIRKEDFVGKNVHVLFPDLEETGRYEKYLKVIETGKPLYIDGLETNSKFGKRYLSVRAFKVGRGLGIITTDITERKRAEEALRES